MAAMKR